MGMAIMSSASQCIFIRSACLLYVALFTCKRTERDSGKAVLVGVCTNLSLDFFCQSNQRDLQLLLIQR